MARRNIWIEPVTDRVKADADYMASLKARGWDNLADAEKEYWLYGDQEELSASDDLLGTVDGEQLICFTRIVKGAINVHDYNRIEKNCIILAERLNSYGYSVTIQAKTDWAMTDFPYHYMEIDRIRDNVNALLDAYARMPGSPDIRYVNTLRWDDANSLEQNIKNIDTLLQRMVKEFFYFGEIYSGEDDYA